MPQQNPGGGGGLLHRKMTRKMATKKIHETPSLGHLGTLTSTPQTRHLNFENLNFDTLLSVPKLGTSIESPELTPRHLSRVLIAFSFDSVPPLFCELGRVSNNGTSTLVSVICNSKIL
jgi:hypothetical protein